MNTKNVEAEFIDIENKKTWPILYQKIGSECLKYPYTCIEAKKPENKPLNRYRDVNPYDHSRIVLKNCERDYINANMIKVDRANRKYILTQGPLEVTVGHFWLMVWEQNSRAILMLNKLIEKNDIKCYCYWPRGIGETQKMVLADVNLSIEQISEEDCYYYTTRKFIISYTDSLERREVVQFHYTTWPDFGVPSSPFVFLEYLKKVRLSGALEPHVGPPVVHCSAGIGRSGTFCLVDSCLVIVEKEGLESLNIQQILLDMRRDRMGLIQTPDQLRFSYQAVIEGSKLLNPNWEMDATIYSTVAEEVETPPSLPRRSESLTRAPTRPLPAIPVSNSLGYMHFAGALVFSSSDECSPTPPAKKSPSRDSSTDDEDEEPALPVESCEPPGPEPPGPEPPGPEPPGPESPGPEPLRRRRARDLAERVSSMKKRARDTERQHALKRSLYKPLTVTFGFLLAGIVIYFYVKH